MTPPSGSFGRVGAPFGRRGATFGRAPVTTPPPVNTAGAWPPQSISAGRGITLNSPENGPDWKVYLDDLWDNILTAGGKAALQRGACRIEVRGDALEPSAGTYEYSAGSMGVVSNKVAWCQAHGIRPYLTYSFHPPFYIAPILMSVTVSRVNIAKAGDPAVWRARLTGTSIGTGNFVGIHVQVNGVPKPALVSSQASGAVTLDKDVTNPGAIPSGAQTATFGPYTGAPYAEQDRHMGVDPTHMFAIGEAVADMAYHYRAAKPIIGGFNEVNGQFRRPAQDVANETLKQRFIYRAVKQYDPSVIVVLSSVSNAGGTDTDGWSLDGQLYLRATWQYMNADTTWQDWVKQATPTATNHAVSGNDLKSLLAKGLISDRIYADMFDDHTYGWTRIGAQTGRQEGDDNIGHWERANNSIAVKWVQIVNDLYDNDTTTAKNGLAHMKGCSGETGLMFDPRAKTGQGAFSADCPELVAAKLFDHNGIAGADATGSDEESYAHDTFVFQHVDGARDWPTGGSIPVYKGPKADPADHWAFVSMQRLAEHDESYGGAGTFFFQGYFNRAGVLKRSSRTSRPNLNSGIYANSAIGSGVDKVDALNKDWKPTS